MISFGSLVGYLATLTGANGLERAMYAWGTDHVATQGARDTFISFCTTHDVDTVFLDMYGMLGSSNYSAPNVAAVQDLVGRFKALGAGKKVYALAGDVDWSTTATHAWIAANITQKIVDYNAASTASQRFDGFHLDVEYWTGAQATTDALSGMSALVTDMRASLGHVGMFTAFYLVDDTNTRPSVLFNGKTQQDGKHLLDMADHVVVGTYRDTADVNLVDDVDGIINLIQPWYDYALANSKPVYSGVETTNVAPSYITFFGQTKAAMETQIDLANAAFTGNVYLGLAVHSYAGWSALSD